MKNILKLVFFLTLFINSTQGQLLDHLWYLKNGEIRNVQSIPQNFTGQHLLIDSISPPKSSPDTMYSNDFFIIYNNGDYYLSNRNGQQSDVYSRKPSSVVKYEIEMKAEAKYFYFSNRYEEDDPKARISNPQSPSTNSGQTVQNDKELIPLKNMLHNESYSNLTHQDLLNGTDVVFIIDKDYVNGACGNYTLCYNFNSSAAEITFNPMSFTDRFQTNNLIYVPNGGTSISYDDAFFDERCLELNADLLSNNVFINFRVECDSLSTDEDIYFTLKPASNSLECPTITDTARVSSIFHDPNYIELECVWMDPLGDKYAIYHIECYNELAGTVSNLTLETILPDQADMTDIEFLQWEANCNDGCGLGPNNLTDMSDYSINKVKVEFPVGLSGFDPENMCNCTGWFKFKVKLKPDTDLIFDNLTPSSPISIFDTSSYNIVDFYQDMTCYDTNELTLFKADSITYIDSFNFLKCIPGRVISSECYVKCEENKCSFIDYIKYAVAILIVLLIIALIRKKP